MVFKRLRSDAAARASNRETIIIRRPEWVQEGIVRETALEMGHSHCQTSPAGKEQD